MDNKNINVCYCIKDFIVYDGCFIESEKYYYYKEDNFHTWVFKDINTFNVGYRFFNYNDIFRNYYFSEYFIPLTTLRNNKLKRINDNRKKIQY